MTDKQINRLDLPPHYLRKALSLYWTGQGHSMERVWIVYDRASNRHIAEGDSIKEARENARKVLLRKRNRVLNEPDSD